MPVASHTSAPLQASPSLQVVPLGFLASFGHVGNDPVHVSAMSHWFAAVRHVAPALPAGCWQTTLVPLHVFVVHGFAGVSSEHNVPAAFFASVAGHEMELPVQTSARSHSSATGRHTVPAFPAGCWQTTLVPLHVFVVHGFAGVSSEHNVPAAFFASVAGHEMELPVQTSARSHSSAIGRQTVPAFPAGCWQTTLVPLHVFVVHGLAGVSSEHNVPAAFFASVAGHEMEVPVQTSARSHSSAAGRQTAPAFPAVCWQARLTPLHLSAVHGIAGDSSGQFVPFALGDEQIPCDPATLHEPHSHDWSQQKPLAQNPLAHCVPVVHAIPIDGS